MAVMGGLNNDGFNFVRHSLVDQTRYVLENWPGTLVTTHVGGGMITGETLTSTTPINNPVRRSYELEWHQGPEYWPIELGSGDRNVCHLWHKVL
jgi:hypothetical protein